MYIRIAEAIAYAWNLSHPVGTKVAFVNDKGETAAHETKCEAYVVEVAGGVDYLPVIHLHGKAGFVLLSRCVPMKVEAATADELLVALEDLLGDSPSVQKGVCQHCGRAYDENDIWEGDCPSDDCPSFVARKAIAKAKGNHDQVNSASV